MISADAKSAYNNSGMWLGAMVGTLVGVGSQLQQARLWPSWLYLVCGATAILGAVALWVWRGHARATPTGSSWIGMIGALLCCAALVFAVTGWRAGLRLQERLAAALEGEQVVIEGVVEDLPEQRERGVNFLLRPEAAWWHGEPVELPRRVSLYWPSRSTQAPTNTPAMSGALMSAQRWRLSARLARPPTPLNPGGFDLSLWWLDQGIGATGMVQVRGSAPPRLVDEGGLWHIDRLRQVLRDRIAQRVSDQRNAGVLAALAMGDQSAIDRDDWDVFRRTGVAHLMSISGLHITMFAWLSAALCARLWRRSTRLMLACPAPLGSAIAGVIVAAGYAWFAGWGVPAQRTLLMLGIVTAWRATGRLWPPGWVLGLAATAVLWLDPWAWAQAGFWLSFVAVAVLMLGAGPHADPGPPAHDPPPGGPARCRPRWDAARSRARAAWRWIAREAAQGGRTQWIATFSLAPLSMAFFQQVSVVGLLANLLVIPWVSFVITPLALLGALWPPCWDAGAWAVGICSQFLGALSSWRYAVWVVPAAPTWAVVAATLGFALWLAPLPWRLRLLGLPLVWPLVFSPSLQPSWGHFEVLVFDNAPVAWTLIRSANHVVVWGDESKLRRLDERQWAQEQARLYTLLRPLGIQAVDAVLSTGYWPNDPSFDPHRPGQGGEVRAVSQRWPHAPCGLPRRWQWDGLEWQTLGMPSPSSSSSSKHEASSRCVLRVRSASAEVVFSTDTSAVIAGWALAGMSKPPLRLVVLPGMPSLNDLRAWRNASAQTLLYAGDDTLRVAGSGHRTASGAQPRDAVLTSSACGAMHWHDDMTGVALRASELCEKQRLPRYWRPASDGSAESGGEREP